VFSASVISILQAIPTDHISSARNQPVNDCTLVTASQNFLQSQGCFTLLSICDFFILKVEDLSASVYQSSYQSTQRHTQEYRNDNISHSVNFKSHIIMFLIYKLKEKNTEQIYKKRKEFSVGSFAFQFPFLG
jgi:hypothetical protein